MRCGSNQREYATLTKRGLFGSCNTENAVMGMQYTVCVPG